ncbi:MAG: NosD domain-containing protein [Thermoplasmatota archaeon]
MKRNTLALALPVFCVVCLLLAPSAVPADVVSVSFQGNGGTLYVGGAGPGNYTRIQDALDDAGDGDVVYVYNGIYRERIRISTSVILEGEDRNGTVVDGGGDGTVVEIAAAGAVMRHLTITGGGGDGWDMPAVNVTADDVALTRCVIRDNEHTGVSVLAASDCTISFNRIVNTSYTGVRVGEASASNDISGNRIAGGISGVYVYSSGGQMIRNNSISGCSKGIYLEESHGNMVAGNHLTGNQEGLFCSYAAGNTIQSNDFVSNIRHARFVKYLHPGFLAPNRWNGNYWDDWMGVGGKIVFGAIYVPTFTVIGVFVPWIEVDWHPAAEPHQW